MLETITIKIKNGSLTLRPSPDDQLHVEGSPQLVPEVRGSHVVLDGESLKAIHATVLIPVPAGRLDASIGRGPCHIAGLTLMEADINVGMGPLVIEDARATWDLNVGKGDAQLERVEGNLDVNVGMGRLDMIRVQGTGDINGGLGAIRAQGCGGRFDVNAGKGDILWVDGQGRLDLNAGLGKVEIRGGHGDALEIAAGMGRVSLDGGRWSRAGIEAGRGDVHVTARVSHLSVDIKQSGDIDVLLPGDEGSRLEASTDRGRIVSHLNLISVNHAGPQRGERLVGVLGDGSGSIILNTRRGDIILALSDDAHGDAQGPGSDATIDADQRLVILAQLRDGQLSVDEAEMLLAALDDR